jgi:hypothetical protein
LIDDLYEIFVDVKRFKQRKGIKWKVDWE